MECITEKYQTVRTKELLPKRGGNKLHQTPCPNMVTLKARALIDSAC